MPRSPGDGPGVASSPGAAGPYVRDSLTRRLVLNGPSYAELVSRAIACGVSPLQLARFQWPHRLPATDRAPMVSIEFTNDCNLACSYCDNRLRTMPRGFMTAATFARLVASVREANGLVKVTGNGECTLHPDFGPMMRELAAAARYLIVMTNGQWRDVAVADDLLRADLVSVSIDAGTPGDYEGSRRGGHFDRLMRNVRALGERRRALGSRARIVVRVMVRPSQRTRERALMAQWRPYADAVLRSYIYQLPDLEHDPDVFVPARVPGDRPPRCGSPFKQQDVNWTGNVPLCGGSARQVGPPGLIVGNVRDASLAELWQHPLLRQYREGIRRADHASTPMCRGCTSRL